MSDTPIKRWMLCLFTGHLWTSWAICGGQERMCSRCDRHEAKMNNGKVIDLRGP